MQSAFAGIEIGKRSLIAHTTGLTTIGHNLSNVGVEGYSRQRVQMQPYDPIYFPGLNREETAGQIGQGVEVESINRVRDVILEKRIVAQANGQGYWEMRDKYLLMVEQVYNEPGEYSVRSLMDRFWDSWQELSIYPEKRAMRQSVIERGQNLIAGIQQEYRDLKEIRDMIEEDVKATVVRTNNLLGDISALNDEILKVKAMGDNPNDLLDRRDLLIKELSSIINITVDNRDPDEFIVNTGGMHLIQGKLVNYIDAVPDLTNEGYARIAWKESGESVRLEGGKLTGLVELRDIDVRGEIQKLDTMTLNFVDLVNEIHTNAYGLNGKTGVDFFREYPFVLNNRGNYDANGDGNFDSSYIFRVNGSNVLNGSDQAGIQGTMIIQGPDGNISIDYYPTDTVFDIIHKINTAGAEIKASLNAEGKFQLKATSSFDYENPDFVIRHLEDDGYFLTGYTGILAQSGPAGAYTWDQTDAADSFAVDSFSVAPVAHPAGWLEMNRDIVNDPDSIAAGFGINGHPAESGDGSAALAVAELRNRDIAIGQYAGFDDYFAAVIAEIGLRGETAQRSFETESLIMKELDDMREALSGVNIDEELSQMIKFQHGYNAASRFVTEIDKMLDTIINRMGV
ncbi:MAG: flagellar hook-associated protein FlgK [Spirochaetales bacterium]|nr:flagellar hook-associated protein FlgK [Spirochaetales bacterium]